MSEEWCLIMDPAMTGEQNMARDLALHRAVAAGDSPPLLRCYSWSPPALSLGRFQKAEEVVDREACRRLGVDLVRRPTGGRAVLHHRELTYSVVVREDHAQVPAGIIEAYRLFNGCIVQALDLLNIKAALAPKEAGGGGIAPGSCFDTAAAYEVRVAGKKVAGSAQLRRDGALLQHGAILFELSLDLCRQVLLPLPGTGVSAYLQQLGREAAGLLDLGYDLSPASLAEALVESFSRVLAVRFKNE
ncbi:MAG: biotin/lipoate A/B protein ligase family protein [Bacillota bacterium]